MKISKIVLYNIGPYVGENIFNLKIDKNKNIVLIGGKNGAGKTTFFKSIKTCLYGCKVWGFDANGKEYYAIIDSMINMSKQYENTVKAFVQLDLEFNDGKEINTYSLCREWYKNKKNIEEIFFVKKNDSLLSSDEQADFNTYLLSIIPPDMFNFYFFDGESIAEFFLGNDGDKNFKNAFLKLYGLDTLSLMVENFQRYAKKKGLDDTVFNEYNNAKLDVEKAELDVNNCKNLIRVVSEKLDLAQVNILALQNDYSSNGGISLSEWKELNQCLLKEDSIREENNKYLKESANTILPFIIIKENLASLLIELNEQQFNDQNKMIINSINNKNTKKRLMNFMFSLGYSASVVNSFYDFIDSEYSIDDSKQSKYDFSSSQLNRIINQINEKSNFDEKNISKAIKDIDSSLKRSKKLRDKLMSSSVEGFESLTIKREKLEKDVFNLNLELEKLKTNLVLLEKDLQDKEIVFSKSKTNYENLLKNKSINDISNRAIAAYTLLEDKLIRRQSVILQNEFRKCFMSIINKDNFVDGIVVDKNINIIPYKFVKINYSQIDNYLKKHEDSKFIQLFDNFYIKDINDLRIGIKDEIILPTPITSPFSQGERQVYIMSIYLALLKTSKKDIPFFIDTPFARIDSNHRKNIVNEFFKGVDNQMFILSTDEEIVGQYKKQINDKISNNFVLRINGYGKTEIIPDAYFEV